MMMDAIRAHMKDFLKEKGFCVVSAYSPQMAKPHPGATLSLALKSAQSATPGFGHYLGEQFNEERGLWEELYGRKVDLTFGLDLYGEDSQGVCDTFDSLLDAFHLDAPTGLQILAVTGGALSYEKSLGLYYHPAQVTCQAYIYAVSQEGDVFTDFEVRGVTI